MMRRRLRITREGGNSDGRSQPAYPYRELLHRFRTLGARDPEDWAKSEVDENIAQLARFCFLRSVWRDAIVARTTSGTWIDRSIAMSERRPDIPFGDAGPALKRLLDAGATRADLQRVARLIAYEAAFELINRLDEGCDPELDGDYPGWRLMETKGNELTGRDVGGLHESLLEMDPSGREGRP